MTRLCPIRRDRSTRFDGDVVPSRVVVGGRRPRSPRTQRPDERGFALARRNSGASPNTATAWRSGTRSRRCRRSASTWALRACGLRRRQLVAQPGVLGLQLHHAADALEVHPLGGELGDAAQHLDVGVGVATVAALRARRVEQAAPLVLAQRLRMHAGELGGDRDHVDGSRAPLSHHSHAHLGAAGVTQRLDRGALLAGQLAGHRHVDRDDQVTGGLRRGDALALDAVAAARLRPRLDAQDDVGTAQRRDADHVAEGRLPEVDRSRQP